MPYQHWHEQATKKAVPSTSKQAIAKTEARLYVNTIIFGIILFAGIYWYTSSLGIPGVLNKSIADTSIILIGSSMLLTSLCYFWDFLDRKIVYRKYLGLVGFAFAFLHIALSYETLTILFDRVAWQTPIIRPVFAGAAATLIFSIMALVSNQFAAHELGGIWWRRVLRTGYLALIFVFLHVFWLKSARWILWWQEGTNQPPSMSFLVAVFILLVLVMRLALWLDLHKKKS